MVVVKVQLLRRVEADGDVVNGETHGKTLYLCACGFWGRLEDEAAHLERCEMDGTTAVYLPAAPFRGLLHLLSDPVVSDETVRLAADDVLRWALDRPKAAEPRTWENPRTSPTHAPEALLRKVKDG